MQPPEQFRLRGPSKLTDLFVGLEHGFLGHVRGTEAALEARIQMELPGPKENQIIVTFLVPLRGLRHCCPFPSRRDFEENDPRWRPFFRKTRHWFSAGKMELL